MLRKKEKLKEIPIKNYFYLLGILLGGLLVVFYGCRWYTAYEKHQLTIPVIDKVLSEITLEELDHYISYNQDVIIYVTKSDLKETRDLEEEFIDIIKDYNLSDKIVYFNLYNNANYLNEINASINKEVFAPVILMYRDGVLYDYIGSSNESDLKIDEIVHFLENYEIIIE